jgi:hypothetical protein
VLVWDPSDGSAPLELGHQTSSWTTVAGLPDGRVVTAALDGRLDLWNLARSVEEPAQVCQLGGPLQRLPQLAALPHGRVVTGWPDGRVLVWDPDATSESVAEVGRHEGIQVFPVTEDDDVGVIAVEHECW